MECLQETIITKFHPDTLQVVRKMYGLDQKGSMSDAIDILQEWVKKQDHFVKKDFDRDILERLIIRAKGSVERAKKRLESMCTSKTLMPMFFEICDIRKLHSGLKDIQELSLPRLTEDHYRVYILRNVGQKFEGDFFTKYCKRLIYIMEYELRNDYAAGIVAVFDYSQTNLVALLKTLNLVEMQQLFSIIMECYGYRIKGIHMISSSKVIETIVGLFKKVISAKVGNRIHIHNNIESVYEHVDKDILPQEYGGKELPLTELHKLYWEVLSSEENINYTKMMYAANTNEAYRRTDQYNEQVLGMPGSFRSLRVD